MQEDARKSADDAAVNPDFIVQKFSPLPTGIRIGEWSIQSVLGAGEFGITYVAVPAGGNRRTVIKEYMPRAIALRDGPTVRSSAASMPTYAWGLDRFLAEGRTLTQIKHLSVCSVQAVFEANGTGYQVMVHEIGRDLNIWRHELRHAPTQAEFDAVLVPLLEGVGELHRHDILHLDLRPANILIREDGTPVLIDFGAARAGLRHRLGLKVPTEMLPMLPPEVAASDQTLIGPGSDIYALAAVFYMLTTGTEPPPAAQRILRDRLVPTAQAAKAKYRPSLLRAIDDGLKYRPDERPSDIADWSDALLSQHPEPAPRNSNDIPVFDAFDTAEDETLPSKSPHGSFDYGGANAEPASLMEIEGFRKVFYAAIGAVIGTVGGLASSVIIASMIWSRCTTDACAAPVAPFSSLVGLVIGCVLGLRYAAKKQPKDGNQRPEGTYNGVDV